MRAHLGKPLVLDTIVKPLREFRWRILVCSSQGSHQRSCSFHVSSKWLPWPSVSAISISPHPQERKDEGSHGHLGVRALPHHESWLQMSD